MNATFTMEPNEISNNVVVIDVNEDLECFLNSSFLNNEMHVFGNENQGIESAFNEAFKVEQELSTFETTLNLLDKKYTYGSPSNEMPKSNYSEATSSDNKKNAGSPKQNVTISHNNNFQFQPQPSMINHDNINLVPYNGSELFHNNNYYFFEPLRNYCTNFQMLPINYNNAYYEAIPFLQPLSRFPNQNLLNLCPSLSNNIFNGASNIDPFYEEVANMRACSMSIMKESSPQSRAGTSHNNKTTIQTILKKDKLVDYINSLRGSKRLQFLLREVEHSHPDVILLFDHISPFLGKISNHNFGNYFIQALLQKIPLSRRKLAWSFYNRRDIMDYASHQFGYHSVQALIEAAVGNSEEKFVVGQLEKHFDNLAFNANGCYILFKILSKFHLENCWSLYNYIRLNFISLSSCSMALNLAKKFVKLLASSTLSQLRVDFLSSIPEQKISKLLKDEHGSQVVMAMLSEWDNPANRMIIDIVAKRIIYYMAGRFSQSIVSKCLQISENKVSNPQYIIF